MGLITTGMRGRVDVSAWRSGSIARKDIDRFCKPKNLTKLVDTVAGSVRDSYSASYGEPVGKVVATIGRHEARFITAAVTISQECHAALFTALQRLEPKTSSVEIIRSNDNGGCTCNRIVVSFSPPLT